MKNWMQLILAAAVAALIGFGSAFYAAPERSARGAAPDEGYLLHILEELRSEQESLGARLLALPPMQAVPAVATRTPVRDLDQAIAAYMANRLGEGGSEAQPMGQAPDREAEAIADRILFQNLTFEEKQDLWQQLRENGQIDAVVAAIEREAELAPNNPDLQAELGKAYVQKIFDVGMGPMAISWSEKADAAFDDALELDETHWDARFNKAMSLSHQPAFMGRQNVAMRQFEILIEQQERSTQLPRHAMAYEFLGNLYEQSGDLEKAGKTRQRGLGLFPESESLRRKLEDE
jgi:tetratricopeptide (TPR) repeat protein